MNYRIVHEATNDVLATDLTADAVDAWWQAHGDRYFGVRVEGSTITVCDAAGDDSAHGTTRPIAVAHLLGLPRKELQGPTPSRPTSPATAQDDPEGEMKLYGCTREQLERLLERDMDLPGASITYKCVSMLSDVQELMERMRAGEARASTYVAARHLINRVKFAVSFTDARKPRADTPSTPSAATN